MFIQKLICFWLVALTSVSGSIFADDTELYVSESSVRTGNRPKVLIIFDNSGSMKTIESTAVGNYDPKVTYAAVGSANSYQGRMLYFTKGTGIDATSLPVPDSPSESRRFLDEINGCKSSKEALNTYGRFTGYLREYSTKGKSGSWEELPDNKGANVTIIDCWEDIETKNSKNAEGIADGFPVDGKLLPDGKTSAPYNFVSGGSGSAWDSALVDAKKTKFGTGTPVTLYTDNYLRWHTLVQQGKLPVVPQSRLDIAKDAITNIVNSTPSVDFGLAVFNINYPNEGERDGGRIVSGIRQMTPAAKSALLSTIDSLPANTNTPLCETLFEAYQYFSAGLITYGHKDSKPPGYSYTPNKPPYDTSIESGANYISPFNVCADVAYIIYITDGSPTVDANANAAIKTLTVGAASSGDYSSFSEKLSTPSYLPALASYIFNNDLIKKVDSKGTEHKQTVRTFTIGFSEGATDAAPLLNETAKRGGGQYFAAQDSLELQAALSDALSSILAIDASFTSPSIASNNFDKTQTFNSAYYAMFLPTNGPRWSGNLKKLKVNAMGEIVGPGGLLKAIDTTGSISADACTYWNSCSGIRDGNKVREGGVLPSLRSQLKGRKIYTDSGTGLINIKDSTFVATYSQNDLDWLYGVDVDDDNKDKSNTDARVDIMGDPLHSKPLALNFGTATSLDVRIIVGTNQGLVHMFKDSDAGSDDYSIGTVSETWAFIPNELWGNVTALRENFPSGIHSVYGMDLSPVAYTKVDGSGKIDKAWIFLGMRSGGASYYALDISKPDMPSYKWMINSDSLGFEDLGQTWSQPAVTTIKGIADPVLIFGGGMASTFGTGQAIYLVNANTGALIKKFADAEMGSVVSKVALLDSDNDGYTDRLYSSDILGHVWRMDLAGIDNTKWSLFKFASIAGQSPDNRRFFSEPVIAQTEFNNVHSASGTLSYQKIPYDAVTIGTGNRDNPLDVTTNDMFYVFQDRNVVTQNFTTKPEALTLAELYPVTSAVPNSQTENIAFGLKRGWYYDFAANGEKSLSASLIFDGKVYFTSFVPPSNQVVNLNAGVCGLTAGQGRLYVFDLHKGTRTTSAPYYEVGERVPDTPQIVIPKPKKGKDAEAYIIGVGKGECLNGECKGTIGLGGGLKTNKIYYHINE